MCSELGGLRSCGAMSEQGFGPEDVPAARRALFDVAVEQASAQVSPAVDFDSWVEAMWEELGELLGWAPRPWPGSWLPSGDGGDDRG